MILEAVADAFISVSVLVAALFVLFGWLRIRWGSAFESLLTRRQSTGPAFAVLATFPPGCVGVLAVSRLYVRGSVSYGTVLAALVSTMGDAAWLLLATEPLLTAFLKVGFALLGATTGLVVDRLGIRPHEDGTSKDLSLARSRTRMAAESRCQLPGGSTNSLGSAGTPLSVESGACRSRPVVSSAAAASTAPSSALTILFLACIASGLIVSIPVTLHLVPEETVEMPSLVVGGLGTAMALALVLISRGRLTCGEEGNQIEQTMPEVLRNCGRETAFVTVWVGGVFVAWEIVARQGWLGDDAIPLEGLLGVAVAAAVGLIPACGVEVLMSTLFVTGVLPAPALVAYLLSQDGNGLIPIAARRPRAALHGTILTTALALGAGVLLLPIL